MLNALRVPLLWLGAVLVPGSSQYGTHATGPWVIPALNLLVPWATSRELNAMHLDDRKLWLLTQYAILVRLLLQGLLARRRTSMRAAAWAALLICVATAFVDEAHQSMLPARTGSVGDVMLDCLGALMMLMMLRARYEPVPAPAAGRAAASPEPGG